MKISFLLLCSFLISSLHSIAQDTKKFDPANARDGENIEYCHQHVKMAKLRKNQDFIEMNKPGEIEFQQRLKEPNQKGTIYKIPVVFHVLHSEGL